MEIQKNKFMNIYGSLMDIYDFPKREAQIKINIFDLKKQNGYSLYV